MPGRSMFQSKASLEAGVMPSQFLARRRVGRRTVNARHFTTHRTNIGAELTAMVNTVEQRQPQQSTNGVSHDDFLLPARQPGGAVPNLVIQLVQLFSEDAMIAL